MGTWKDLEKHMEATASKPAVTHVMSKGTGVCAFKTAEDATAAIAAVNGTELKGKTLEVDVWTKREKTDGEAEGAGGDDKWSLVNKIKAFQRSSEDIMRLIQGMFGKGGGKGGWGKGKGKGKDSQRQTMRKLKEIDTGRKVWVGGLPNGLTWKDLEKHFESTATKPALSEVMGKGTGVCAFKTADEATAAIAAVNGTEL